MLDMPSGTDDELACSMAREDHRGMAVRRMELDLVSLFPCYFIILTIFLVEFKGNGIKSVLVLYIKMVINKTNFVSFRMRRSGALCQSRG